MGRQTITFASLRPQCPSPTIATASGGSLTAGSLYFGFVGMNRVGLNKPSTLQQVTWTANQKIQITLPSTIRQGAEELHRLLICASASNSTTALQPLCWWRGITRQQIGSTGFYQEVQASLPATIELAYDTHLTLGGAVANPTALTALTNVLDGQVRYVTSLGLQFYYDPTSSLTVDGTTVISAGANPGRWLPWLLGLTTGVGSITDITGQLGCSRDVRALVDADILFTPPAYAMDNSVGPGATYWICNGSDESGTTITAGTRIMLDVFQSGQPKSQLFDKRLKTQLKGYVRQLDGTLSTSGLSIAQQDYAYGLPIYTLEADLLSGYGAVISIAPHFNQEELDGYLQRAPISTLPYFSTQAGAYLTGYRLWGDIIYPLGDRRRIYPRPGASVQVGSGAGLVQRYEFDLRSAQTLTIPTTNVSNAKVTVNSNGDVFYRGSDTNQPTEVTRAILTMASGRSNPSAANSYQAVATNGALSIVVTYPTTIRSNYSDAAIAGAGSSQGVQLNAPYVCLYIQRQSDGQIREFVNNAVVPGASQTFLITNFTAGTVISSLPSTTGDFGFWASTPAPTVTVQAGTGSFASGSYRVYWGFRYDGTTVSSISHDVNNGCVAELSQPISQLFSQLQSINNQITAWNNGTDDISPSLLNLSGQSLIFNADASNTGTDFPYTLQAPAVSAARTLTLPATAGSAGQILATDGAGNASWATSNSGWQGPTTINYNSGTTINLGTLRAGKYLTNLMFLLFTPFTGGYANAAMSVGGTLGTTYKFLPATDVNLRAAAGTTYNFQVDYVYAPNADETIQVTLAANGCTAGQILAFYQTSN